MLLGFGEGMMCGLTSRCRTTTFIRASENGQSIHITQRVNANTPKLIDIYQFYETNLQHTHPIVFEWYVCNQGKND